MSVPPAADDVAVPPHDGRHLFHHAVRRVHQLYLVARLEAEDEVALVGGAGGIQDISVSQSLVILVSRALGQPFGNFVDEGKPASPPILPEVLLYASEPPIAKRPSL